MLRLRLTLGSKPQVYRYLDSLHAALVAGLSASGVPSERILGAWAAPWTFAPVGRLRRDGSLLATEIVLSTADIAVAESIRQIPVEALYKASSNGDVIDMRHAEVRTDDRIPDFSYGFATVEFANGFAVALKGESPTRFARNAMDAPIADAIKGGLDRRAGRVLDLNVIIDRLTLSAHRDATPRRLRKSPKGDILIPGFAMPLVLKGNPEDIRWAFHAGLGSKTHQGLGCPLAIAR